MKEARLKLQPLSESYGRQEATKPGQQWAVPLKNPEERKSTGKGSVLNQTLESDAMEAPVDAARLHSSGPQGSWASEPLNQPWRAPLGTPYRPLQALTGDS